MEHNLSDVAAERAVISAICQYGKLAYLDCVDILSHNSFSVSINQCLYTILSYIYSADIDKKVDLSTLMSAAKEIGLHNEIDDELKHVRLMFDFSVELSNIRNFSQKLRKLQEVRNLLCKVDDTARAIQRISGNESLSEIIAIAEKPIFDFTNSLLGQNQQVEQIGVGLREYLLELQNNPNTNQGVDIGCPIWQNAIGGLNMGVHVIGARKKIGKSFKALNAAIYAAGKTRIPVLYLDTELRKEQGQWIRFLSRVSEIEQYIIKNGLFYQDPILLKTIEKYTTVMENLPLDYRNVSSMDFEEIISTIRRWLVQRVGYNKDGKLNKCLVIYDYLKVTNPNDLKAATEWQIFGYRMGSMHDLCSQYNIPLLTFVQLNRENEIAASDRISWYCTSYSSFHTKTEEERAEDGPILGNRKLIVEDARFGEALDYGDYINYNLNAKISRIKELSTRNMAARSKNNLVIVEENF